MGLGRCYIRRFFVGALFFYLLSAGVMLWMLALACRRERWLDAEPAKGRIVAIVPAYNEDPNYLKACIEALLTSSIVPVYSG